jgi:hypothetical protein
VKAAVGARGKVMKASTASTCRVCGFPAMVLSLKSSVSFRQSCVSWVSRLLFTGYRAIKICCGASFPYGIMLHERYACF